MFSLADWIFLGLLVGGAAVMVLVVVIGGRSKPFRLGGRSPLVRPGPRWRPCHNCKRVWLPFPCGGHRYIQPHTWTYRQLPTDMLCPECEQLRTRLEETTFGPTGKCR